MPTKVAPYTKPSLTVVQVRTECLDMENCLLWFLCHGGYSYISQEKKNMETMLLFSQMSWVHQVAFKHNVQCARGPSRECAFSTAWEGSGRRQNCLVFYNSHANVSLSLMSTCVRYHKTSCVHWLCPVLIYGKKMS